MAATADRRIFISYAARDQALAEALTDFLRLGCDLDDAQVFRTGRPRMLDAGVVFNDVIREALDTAALSIHLLTPAYYESRFCLAELGAVWITKQGHVPLLVPPIDYADLDGVQLGEQALKLDRSSDLDELRDRIRADIGVAVPTAEWNRQKSDFLNKWASDLRPNLAEPETVAFDVHAELQVRAEQLARDNADLAEDRGRLEEYARELSTQNDELRERVPEAPAAPVLEGDEIAQWFAEARGAIDNARARMEELPAIAREALFQSYHSGLPLTVGGTEDRFSVETAKTHAEEGWIQWVEDEAQMVTARSAKPEVDAADAALRRVRELVFAGSSFDDKAEATKAIRPLLKEEYGITDPTFELRPVWEALDFL